MPRSPPSDRAGFPSTLPGTDTGSRRLALSRGLGQAVEERLEAPDDDRVGGGGARHGITRGVGDGAALGRERRPVVIAQQQDRVADTPDLFLLLPAEDRFVGEEVRVDAAQQLGGEAAEVRPRLVGGYRREQAVL